MTIRRRDTYPPSAEDDDGAIVDAELVDEVDEADEADEAPTALVPMLDALGPAGTLTDPIEAAVLSAPSEATRALYRRDIRAFLTELADLFGIGPEVATADDLLRWWSWLQQRGLRPSTINRKAVAIRRFYREGHLRGLFASNPGQLLPTLKVSKDPKGRALSAVETQRLLAACPPDGALVDLRDRLLLSLMVLTGCRRAEALKVDLTDIQSERGHRTVLLRRKGGKEDRQKLVPELSLLIDAWTGRAGIREGSLIRRLVRSTGGDYVAVPGRLSVRSVYDVVQDRARAAGLGKVSPHDLRKTYITACGEMKVPIARTALSVGHENPETTMRYDHQRGFMDDHPSDAVAAWLKGGEPGGKL